MVYSLRRTELDAHVASLAGVCVCRDSWMAAAKDTSSLNYVELAVIRIITISIFKMFIEITECGQIVRRLWVASMSYRDIAYLALIFYTIRVADWFDEGEWMK